MRARCGSSPAAWAYLISRGKALPGCSVRRDLRPRLELARSLQLPRHLRLGPLKLGEAIQFRLVWRRLDVDRDPVRREHLAEKATRLGLFCAVNDFDAGQGVGHIRACGWACLRDFPFGGARSELEGFAAASRP